MTKICKKCEKEKDISEFFSQFYKNRNKTYITNTCKLCKKKYYIDNKEKIITRIKNSYISNKDIILEYKKEYYQLNKASKLEYTKKYFKTKNGKLLAKLAFQKRRALKISSEDGTVTKEAIIHLLEQQNNKCYYCEEKLKLFIKEGSRNRIGYDLEHKTPLSRGGKHSISNIVLSCPTCNDKKGTLTDKEFMEKNNA